MKLRCTHNSIRLRLRKSDIEALQSTGFVQEGIQLTPATQFCFELRLVDNSPEQAASFQDQCLTVYLSEAQASQWIHSQEVSLEYMHPITESETLHILIEKDFPCLDRPQEDQSDTFWELASGEAEAC